MLFPIDFSPYRVLGFIEATHEAKVRFRYKPYGRGGTVR
jgi:hypothetical protein